MKKTNEGHIGTRIIPTKAILSGNKEQIEELIKSVAEKHNVTIEDAALALQSVLRKFTGGK